MGSTRARYFGFVCLQLGFMVGCTPNKHGIDEDADTPTDIDLDDSKQNQDELQITPVNPVIELKQGAAVPSLKFEAKLSGQSIAVVWSVDRGEIGSIGRTAGNFSPTGTVAGQATVTATAGDKQVSTKVTVRLHIEQNGFPASTGVGAAGYGGVGGEGPGVAVDEATKQILLSTPQSHADFKWLYPYDNTVWPLGLLPPLLQWSAGTGLTVDAIAIRLKSEYSTYQGLFGRPPTLASGASIVRHPILSEAWKTATHSAAGKTLTAELIIAAGGKAYGPFTQKWQIAKGSLKGTVYYQSYGTKLAKNYSGAIGGDGKFGGATLAIRGNSMEPVLVAGASGDRSQCRVCHSVSANGSRMIAQHGDDYAASSSYALNNKYLETAYPAQDSGKFSFVGLSPDGALGIKDFSFRQTGTTALYDMNTGAEVTTQGFKSFVTKAAFPAFSPVGDYVAFNFYEGAGDTQIGAGDPSKLVAMRFDRKNSRFFAPVKLFESSADKAPGWPTFLPTNNGVVFSLQSRTNKSGEFMMTRYGGRGELWWSDLATGQSHALDQANGKNNGVSYLPVGPNNHQDDTTLQYEPTVNPVVSGGYMWVVFTSRRMYGNVATIDPWWSDPREHDLNANVTTKKLWVSAIDLNAAPGTDPSHPAFYLPAQELLAGNTRGYWVVDPCRGDGQSCESGDECCGGYCQGEPGATSLSCTNKTNQCVKEFEKCSTSADCCDYLKGTQCINSRCAQTIREVS